MSENSMRTPLARVRGLGTAKEGVHHWWMQRLTAVALVPLVLWFVISIAGLAGMDHQQAVAWISSRDAATRVPRRPLASIQSPGCPVPGQRAAGLWPAGPGSR